MPFTDEQKTACMTLEAEGVAPGLAADLALNFAANVPGAVAAFQPAKQRGAGIGWLVFAVKNGVEQAQAPLGNAGGAFDRPAIDPETPPDPEQTRGKVAAIRRGARIAQVWRYLDAATRGKLLAARYRPDPEWTRAYRDALPALKEAGRKQRAAAAPAPAAMPGEPQPIGALL